MLGLSASMGTRTDKGRWFSFLTFLSISSYDLEFFRIVLILIIEIFKLSSIGKSPKMGQCNLGRKVEWRKRVPEQI